MTRALWLGIETSSPRLSLALGDGHAILAQHTGELAWRHAETLFDGIDQLLHQKRRRLRDLSGVVVCVGPGSFTGIRIGLAAARALAQAAAIPVVGVNALEAIAADAPKASRWISPRIQGLQNHWYTALYERRGESLRRVLPEQRASIDHWLSRVRAKTKGARVWLSDPDKHFPEAGTLLRLAQPRFTGVGRESWRDVLPLYIRDAAAVERRKKS